MAKTITAPARTTAGNINWASAFMLYAKGLLIEEIAVFLDTSVERVRAKAREEEWSRVCGTGKLPFPSALALPKPDPSTEIDISRVEQEVRSRSDARQKILHEEILKLRSSLDDDIEVTGNSKHGPVTITRSLNPIERAKILKDIAAISKQAREEDAFAHKVPLSTESLTDPGAHAKGQLAQININLPAGIRQAPTPVSPLAPKQTDVVAELPAAENPRPKDIEKEHPKVVAKNKLTPAEIFKAMGVDATLDVDDEPMSTDEPLSEEERSDWRNHKR